MFLLHTLARGLAEVLRGPDGKDLMLTHFDHHRDLKKFGDLEKLLENTQLNWDVHGFYDHELDLTNGGAAEEKELRKFACTPRPWLHFAEVERMDPGEGGEG